MSLTIKIAAWDASVPTHSVTQYRVSLVGTRATAHWRVPGKTCLFVFLQEEGTDPGVSASLGNLFNSLAQDASVCWGRLQRHFGTSHSAWAWLYFLSVDLKSSCISMLKIPHHKPNTAGALSWQCKSSELHHRQRYEGKTIQRLKTTTASSITTPPPSPCATSVALKRHLSRLRDPTARVGPALNHTTTSNSMKSY